MLLTDVKDSLGNVAWKLRNCALEGVLGVGGSGNKALEMEPAE